MNPAPLTSIIIANGPSLNDVPEAFFSLYPTWGVNKIFLPRPGTDFVIRPTYYVTCHENMAPFANEVRTLGSFMFIKDKIAHLFPGATPIKSITRRSFNIEPFNGLWEGWSVIYVCLQLAYWMGFETILLVGLDHDYTNGSYHPQYSEGVDAENGDRREHNQDLLLPGFIMARDAYHKAGRRIINLTPNTKENVFEKGQLSEWYP
jgi:hypothetical protein